MKNLNLLASIILISLFSFSCATTQVVVEPFDTSKTYMTSYDESWKKLVRFFSTNQIGIGTLEKDSGIITVNNQNLSPTLSAQYCSISAPFLFTHTGGQAVGSATLVEDGEFVTANVNMQYTANFQSCNLYGQCNYQSNSCPSNGTFERALLSALD